ncbi:MULTISPECIES: IcmT/TraK family protein [unclassified Cupriavidus]|uniref:IcmT/TraK family protein n=1 Tax=unclassified Cupriavidus TaxID=2640874 RepID=UPI00313D14B6
MKIADWVKSAESTGLPFTSIPAYCSFPMLLAMVHLRLWTISLAVIMTVGVWWLQRKGYTMSWMARRARSKLRGERVTARPIWHVRRFSRLQDPGEEFSRKS